MFVECPNSGHIFLTPNSAIILDSAIISAHLIKQSGGFARDERGRWRILVDKGEERKRVSWAPL
jgi:hypothetical protein